MLAVQSGSRVAWYRLENEAAFFFFFLYLHKSEHLCSFSLQGTAPAHQLRYFKEAESLIILFFFWFDSDFKLPWVTVQTVPITTWNWLCASVVSGWRFTMTSPSIAPFFCFVFVKWCGGMRLSACAVSCSTWTVETAVEGFVIRCRDDSAVERSW